MLPGTVLLYKGFVFNDGAAADKYIIVIGSTASSAIVVKTTSNGTRYRNDHGCQAGNRFPAFLLTQGCCCFPKNTWVCIDEFYELPLQGLLAKVVAAQHVFRFGMLPRDITLDLQHCVATCDDISAAHEQVVRACFVTL